MGGAKGLKAPCTAERRLAGKTEQRGKMREVCKGKERTVVEAAVLSGQSHVLAGI